MRLDKYLKVSRIIKRRTVAKEVADKGRIKVNGILAKSSTDLKVDDLVEIRFGNKLLTVKVLEMKDSTKKESIEVKASEISAYMDYWVDISQYTAVSRISQILPELDELLDYQKKELEAATERSQSSAFWHTKLYDTVTDAINELYKNAKISNQVSKETFAELTELQREIMKKIC